MTKDESLAVAVSADPISQTWRDHVAVTHLLTTYQLMADTGRTRQLSQLFVDDAAFHTNRDVYTGRDEILGFFQRMKASFINAEFLPARHHLSAVHVDLVSPDVAHTYACFQFIGTHGLDHWGTYRDIVRRTRGEWLFVQRTAIVDSCVPNSPVQTLVYEREPAEPS